MDTALSCNDARPPISFTTGVEEDGRLSITLRRRNKLVNLGSITPRCSTIDGTGLDSHTEEDHLGTGSKSVSERRGSTRMAIVIQVVGSRGDVQPFVALGLTLRNIYGHRVRIATHGIFRQFIQENELEFFDIGGDPREMMAFMVRNPGLLPGLDSIRGGDVQQQRENMRVILDGCWNSCVQPTSFASSDHASGTPFIADAIIANPPSFAHCHCAERLGIPLHMMFTMPFSPTREFPHPLAKVRNSDLSAGLTNMLTYSLIERITWYGLGDLINTFRTKRLNLPPINLAWAPGLTTRLNIPHSYCWSPSLLKKPKDWDSKISVTGFFFLPDVTCYEPPPELVAFLEAGEPPIYIGFGSIVVDDPQCMTDLILSAVERAGVRALVSAGWSGLGTHVPMRHSNNVYFVENIPHNWLFKHVSAVVHHGGAGTAAAGLAAGKPTVIVPFFGDQAFWGEVVAKSGVGPRPIHYVDQNAETLACQIEQALQPHTKFRSAEIQATILKEQGSDNGARHFQDTLPSGVSHCRLSPERHAVWVVKQNAVKLSAMAATILLKNSLIETKDLELYRPVEYVLEDLPTDPLTGGALAFLGSFSDAAYQAYALPAKLVRQFQTMSTDLQSEAKRESRALSAQSLQPTTCRSVPCSASSVAGKETSTKHGPRSIRSRLAMAGTLVGITATSIGTAGEALLLAPEKFSLGIARGFQNIPIAYGDKTARKPEKVTGLLQGIEVGSKQFAFGFWDGITGVFTQPVRGARRSGAAGFAQGLAHGMGGLILKPGAGIFGLPAYLLQGASKEVHKMLSSDYDILIARSRLEQGEREVSGLQEVEKSMILRRWHGITD